MRNPSRFDDHFDHIDRTATRMVVAGFLFSAFITLVLLAGFVVGLILLWKHFG